MNNFFRKKSNLAIIILVVIFVAGFLFSIFQNKKSPEPPEQNKSENVAVRHSVIGQSVQGRKIDAYTYGSGKTKILFVGGIHGGYEWNSVVLAYKAMDYLEANPETIPKNLTVTIIPSANPDGVYKIIGKEGRFTNTDVPKGSATAGRFNANGVDLNRNFDCKWQPKSTWQEKVVSGGTSAFSEPESFALKNYILENKPVAVIFWHSQSGSVYASQCEKGILPETINIMNEYSRGSGYSAVKTFDAYATSGDAEGWLAKIGIPAITVEFKNHTDIDWEQNLAGIKSIFKYYEK